MVLSLLAAVIASGVSFDCLPVKVWDGDSLECSSGVKIRVSGIAAREVKRLGGQMVDAGCNDGHPCPRADAIASRNALVRLAGRSIGTGRHGHVLVKGKPLRCISTGSAGRDRVGAWCRVGNVDLSCAMVQGGYALRWDRYWRGHRC